MAKSLPYFTPAEVVIHNKLDDFWVSFLGRVYDLTPFIQKRKGDPAIKPILANAGKDISHWFEPDSGQLRHYVHPITEVSVPYTPHGRLPHVGPQVPTTAWKQRSECRWWEDKTYLIGRLTARARPIRLLNIYTGVQRGQLEANSGARPRVQQPRLQLHLQVRGPGSGHGQDPRPERHRRRKGQLPPGRNFRDVLHPHTGDVLQRRPYRCVTWHTLCFTNKQAINMIYLYKELCYTFTNIRHIVLSEFKIGLKNS